MPVRNPSDRPAAARRRRHPAIASVLAAILLGALAPASAAVQESEADPVALLLRQLETALTGGSTAQFLALTTLDPADDEVRTFTDRWLSFETTRAVLHERDRVDLAGGGYRLFVEALLEAGRRGRLATWQLDVGPGPEGWRVAGAVTLSTVDGLSRLALDPGRQYRARDLVVQSEDLELRLHDGSVFVAEGEGGPTAAVLIGRGEMVFSPWPETEKRQIRLFADQPILKAPFEAALIRFNPIDASDRLLDQLLAPMAADRGDLARATTVFEEEIGRAFTVDLGDMSRGTWSLVPPPGDFLAEVRTRRHGTLTYAHSAGDPEDVALFDRSRRKHISVYASRARVAARGLAYDEDDGTEYDILDHQIDVRFSPDRLWFDGRDRVRLRVRSFSLSAMTIRLAESLVVRSVTSERHGRLLHLRVRNQNSIVVNLAAPASRGDEIALIVQYAGRLEPQGMDRENLAVAGAVPFRERYQLEDQILMLQPQPSYIYSSRSYWYPQGTVSDYATATIRFTVPDDIDVVCSGAPASGSPVTLDGGDKRRLFVFAASRPVRYVGCVVARLRHQEVRDMPLSDADTPGLQPRIRLFTTPRIRSRAGETLERAGDIAAFYAGILGDLPYPDLMIAAIESHLPGGHAPGYMVILNQPLPGTPFVWRDDPASFQNFDEFFVAHELAHQWWGQAVGWQNYHEQWLSEGMAQYFAALYAERTRGSGSFRDILHQFSRWTESASDQGPIYLGYRLGHLKSDGRIFRALVYNKAALVLHMLRTLVGDEAFFRGLRRFYDAHRFGKAGTDDLRRALEAETGGSLATFFDRWIYGQELPSARVRWKVENETLQLSVEQEEPAFPFPLPVTLVYRDGSRERLMVPIREPAVVRQLPLAGPLRRVEINEDETIPVRLDD